MTKKKLQWDGSSDRKMKARLSIEHVGSVSFEVESNLPGASMLTADEKRALALRHAQLLVRGLAKELEHENRR